MSAFAKIEEEGGYRGVILDIVVGETKNHFPQAVVRLQAEEKVSPDGESTPIDSAQVTGYLVLFNNQDIFNEQTVNFNYTNLQKIGEWTDAEFQQEGFALVEALKGEKCYFRMEEHEYNGKTALRVAGVDTYEFSGQITLRPASADQLSVLNAKLKFATAAPKTAPAAKRGRPAKAAVSENPTIVSAGVATTTAQATAVPLPTSKTPPPPGVVDELPAECTKLEAWEYLCSLPHDDDDVVTQAWLTAIKEVGGSQKEYTPAQWAIVRDKARGKLIPF
jgi:hypothetical protein